MHVSHGLARVIMLVAIVVGLIAVVTGFWIMAPFVIVIGLFLAILQTRRDHTR